MRCFVCERGGVVGPVRSIGFEIFLLPFLIVFSLLRDYPIPTLLGLVVLGAVLYNDYQNTKGKQQVVWTNSEEVWRVRGQAERDR